MGGRVKRRLPVRVNRRSDGLPAPGPLFPEYQTFIAVAASGLLEACGERAPTDFDLVYSAVPLRRRPAPRAAERLAAKAPQEAMQSARAIA